MFPDTSNPQNLTNNIPILGLCDQLASQNPLPLKYQLVVETDKLYCNGQRKQKIGNGYDNYNDLPYTIWEPLYDFGSFTDPNGNTPIDAGSLTSPAVNFLLDFCLFNLAS